MASSRPRLVLVSFNVLSTPVLQGPAWVSWASDRLPVRTRAPPLGVMPLVLLLCVSYLVTEDRQLLSLLIVCMSLPHVCQTGRPQHECGVSLSPTPPVPLCPQ